MDSQKEPRKSGFIELVAHAPVVYLVFFFLAALLDYLYPIRPFSGQVLILIGLIFLIGGPLLVLWSQKSVRRFRREIAQGPTAEIFRVGPYRFSRNPTYVGLTLLIAGFGILANSFFVVLAAIFSFVVANYAFVRREERLLEEKYGEVYHEYKKGVRRWI